MKTTKKFLRTLILTLLILASIFALSSCDLIKKECTYHDWGSPTCLYPAKCWDCGMYNPDGKLGNHNYSTATCQEPSHCIECYEYKDDELAPHDFSEYSDGIIKCNNCKILLEEYEFKLYQELQ